MFRKAEDPFELSDPKRDLAQKDVLRPLDFIHFYRLHEDSTVNNTKAEDIGTKTEQGAN